MDWHFFGGKLLLLFLTLFELGSSTYQSNGLGAAGSRETLEDWPVRLAALYSKLVDCISQEPTTVYYDNKPSRPGNTGHRDCLKTGFLQDLQELVKEFVEIGKENKRLTEESQDARIRIEDLQNQTNSDSNLIAKQADDIELLNNEAEVIKREVDKLNNSLVQMAKENELFQKELIGLEIQLKKCHDNTPPQSCQEIQASGKNKSGVYEIYVSGKNGDRIGTRTDGGGWTVFQRREPSTSPVDFDRTWREYADGFGSLTESHWLGLDIVSALTKGGDSELRVELMDWEDEKRFAKYDHFQVDSETEKYKLHVSGYSGDAGDSLDNKTLITEAHNGMYFSTKDRDNDLASGSCAAAWHGAWWYSNCHYANLNGPYVENGRRVPDWKSIIWNTWHGSEYSLKGTEMKLRGKQFQPASLDSALIPTDS